MINVSTAVPVLRRQKRRRPTTPNLHDSSLFARRPRLKRTSRTSAVTTGQTRLNFSAIPWRTPSTTSKGTSSPCWTRARPPGNTMRRNSETLRKPTRAPRQQLGSHAMANHALLKNRHRNHLPTLSPLASIVHPPSSVKRPSQVTITLSPIRVTTTVLPDPSHRKPLPPFAPTAAD